MKTNGTVSIDGKYLGECEISIGCPRLKHQDILVDESNFYPELIKGDIDMTDSDGNPIVLSTKPEKINLFELMKLLDYQWKMLEDFHSPRIVNKERHNGKHLIKQLQKDLERKEDKYGFKPTSLLFTDIRTATQPSVDEEVRFNKLRRSIDTQEKLDKTHRRNQANIRPRKKKKNRRY